MFEYLRKYIYAFHKINALQKIVSFVGKDYFCYAFLYAIYIKRIFVHFIQFIVTYI